MFQILWILLGGLLQERRGGVGRLLHVRLSGRNSSDCLGGRWALAAP